MDDELEKRRRRAQLWQERRRKDAEAAAAENGGDGKGLWSLEDDDDMGDVPSSSARRSQGNGAPSNNGHATPGGDDSDSEIDPLDAFMAQEVMPELDRLKQIDQQEKENAADRGKPPGEDAPGVAPAGSDAKEGGTGAGSRRLFRAYDPYDSDPSTSRDDAEESEDDETWAKNVVAGKGSKLEKLTAVDHTQIDYPDFRKDFLIEAPEIAKMSEAMVRQLRKDLDRIKVKGKDVPKPIKGWHQCGLSTRILQVIQANQFDNPMPIQAQALPVIMQGRDCIGVAKTGSGKTMAFVLPMLRHIKDQPSLAPGDGPVGLIMAPTRELVQQIGKDIKKFTKALGLKLVCVYGGSGVAGQITALKRGAEIVVW